MFFQFVHGIPTYNVVLSSIRFRSVISQGIQCKQFRMICFPFQLVLKSNLSRCNGYDFSLPRSPFPTDSFTSNSKSLSVISFVSYLGVSLGNNLRQKSNFPCTVGRLRCLLFSREQKPGQTKILSCSLKVINDRTINDYSSLPRPFDT